MALSQSASDGGWKTLIEGSPRHVPAELLRPDLASLAFEGESLWDFLLLPELSAMVALCIALCTWSLLMGFFRALIAERAWRRRLSAFEEPSPSLFEECAVLARRVRSGVVALHRSATRRVKTHSAAPSTNVAMVEPATKPASFTFSLFGVHNATGDGHLWSEEDEIE